MSAGPKDVVAFTVSPRSRLWIAACLGIGGAALAGTSMLVLSEHIYALRWSILVGLFGGG